MNTGSEVCGSPALGDIDNDGFVEIVVGSIYNDLIYAFNYMGVYDSTLMPWPQFRQNIQNTGTIIVNITQMSEIPIELLTILATQKGGDILRLLL